MYSEIRALKVDLTFAIGGIKNHELYFAHLGGGGGDPDGRVRRARRARLRLGRGVALRPEGDRMAGRGWAWTAYDWDEGRLFNYIGDAQNTFPVWNATPLVALDVYEHAYFLDYQTDRAGYIGAFFDNLDWDVVNGWVEQYAIPRSASMLTAILVALGYVCGSMPWGYWLVRIFRPQDIRTQGSGNIGATNVWRVHGREARDAGRRPRHREGLRARVRRDEARGARCGRAHRRRSDARAFPSALPEVHPRAARSWRRPAARSWASRRSSVASVPASGCSCSVSRATRRSRRSSRR